MPFDGSPTDTATDWEDRLRHLVDYWRDWLAENHDDERPPRATIDFETRSPCDLKKHGAWLYSIHPLTEAMCLSYRLPNGRRGRWHMAHPQHLIDESPPPDDLLAYVIAGGLVEAHNAFFERCIWRNVMAARHGWPSVRHEQWRCSAAKASAHSLPRDLENAAKAIHLPVEKDMEGRRLMLKMCKPRQPRKDEVTAWMEAEGLTGDFRRFRDGFTEANGPVYHEEEADLYKLWGYCDRDVETEECLSEALPDLTEYEQRIWSMDQWMNERGARFDLDMAKKALDMAAEWRKRLNHELEQMTGISSATKRAQVKEWLAVEEGVDVPDTAADTLEWFIKHGEVGGRARRVIEITKEVNRTSTRKYQAMLDKCDPRDERARDLLMYHGAGTGRWSGKGIQVHNFPARDLCLKDFEEAAEAIKSGNIDWLILLYGDVMEALSHALRGAIVPEEGRDLMTADYSAIEARCVLWEADAQGALDVFRRGDDIYCDMATGIYGYEVGKKTHPGERQFGKQAILGLGYGMGFVTFLLTCRKYDIHFSREMVLGIMGPEKLAETEAWVRRHLGLVRADDMSADDKRQAARVRRRLVEARERPEEIVHELALMKHTVNVYRSRYPEVKDMWKEQEQAAIEAVTTGRSVQCGRVTWFTDGPFLKCRLPSGRCLHYCEPVVKPKKTSWGEVRPHLSYMGVDATSGRWVRIGTYGGKLVENITQAVARDIMAHAMLLAYEGGVYDTIMSVHDELVCEVDKNEGSLEDFEALMSSVPPWAAGCPITAEAERLTRYKK